MKKKFTMSMYATALDLYKAKAEYYKAALDKLWELQKEDGFDECDRDMHTFHVLKGIYGEEE